MYISDVNNTAQNKGNEIYYFINHLTRLGKLAISQICKFYFYLFLWNSCRADVTLNLEFIKVIFTDNKAQA